MSSPYPDARTATEWCPECEWENTIQWDVAKEGYVAYCPHCGSPMLLCDECLHSADNPGHECSPELCRLREATNWRLNPEFEESEDDDAKRLAEAAGREANRRSD